MRDQSSKDWNKVAKVIKSITDLRQVDCAQKMINNFKKVHGLECDHKLLELELKFKSRGLLWVETHKVTDVVKKEISGIYTTV